MTRAFGKVFIAGEYGVLLGCKAVLAQIDRKASCSFSPKVSVNHEKLFKAGFDVCLEHGFPPLPGTYILDTDDFHSKRDGHKLGLGSSAAAISALCRMILVQHQIHDQMLWYRISSLAHDRFSHGLGSGADIAASIFGGIISFQKGAPPEQVLLPDLWQELVFIDTMHSQNTRDFVAQFMAQQQEPFIKDFAKQSHQLVNEFLKKTSPEIFEELFILLHDLGNKASIPIISAKHQAIRDVAKAHGGAAKPSGAGGGDLAIALISKENRASFENEMGRLGFDLLDLKLNHN